MNPEEKPLVGHVDLHVVQQADGEADSEPIHVGAGDEGAEGVPCLVGWRVSSDWPASRVQDWTRIAEACRGATVSRGRYILDKSTVASHADSLRTLLSCAGRVFSCGEVLKTGIDLDGTSLPK